MKTKNAAIAASAFLWPYGRARIAIRLGLAGSGPTKTNAIAQRHLPQAGVESTSSTFGTPVLGPVLKATMRLESPEGSKPFSGVTTAPNTINLATISGASKSTRPALQMTFGSYTVVPDPEFSPPPPLAGDVPRSASLTAPLPVWLPDARSGCCSTFRGPGTSGRTDGDRRMRPRYRLRLTVWLIRRIAILALDLVAAGCDRIDGWLLERRYPHIGES